MAGMKASRHPAWGAFLGLGDLPFGKARFLPPCCSAHIIITSKNIDRLLLCVARVHLRCSRAFNGIQPVLLFCHLVSLRSRNVHRQIKLPSQVKVCLRGSPPIVAQILAFWSHLEETDLPGTHICLPDSDCRGFKVRVRNHRAGDLFATSRGCLLLEQRAREVQADPQGEYSCHPKPGGGSKMLTWSNSRDSDEHKAEQSFASTTTTVTSMAA